MTIRQQPLTSSPPWRFGFGEVAGPVGCAWRLWIGSKSSSDVYLSTRSLASEYKTSIHKSGRCQTSLTKEKFGGLEKGSATHLRFDEPSSHNSRHLAKWNTLEIVPGVALALRIIVPASELDDL